MFPLTALLTCDLMNEEVKNQRLFYKLCYAELSEIEKRTQKFIKAVNEFSEKLGKTFSDDLEKTSNIFLGKGYDKLLTK